MNREAIIAKIMKCLALAKSSNEYEAAIALRQAQRLMQQHGISDLDVAHADIQEEATRAGAVTKPAKWECALALRVAAAFDCQVWLRIGYPAAQWVFTGGAPAGEIARYAFEVLFRQIKRARNNYRKTKLKRCTTTLTRRADTFCEGWVVSATALIERFSGSAEQQQKITAYLEQKHQLHDFQARDRNAGRQLTARDWEDKHAGMIAGRDAQLNRGVGGVPETLALAG